MNRLFLITLSVLMLATIAGAQAPEQSWENLRSLGVGEKIQVVDQKLKSQNGTFVSVSDEAITFQASKDAVTIQRADVFRVSSRQRGPRGHPRLRKSLIGLAVGGGLGAVTGATEKGNPDAPSGAVGAALGAVIYGGIGAGIGAALPPGHLTIYRAERRKDQTKP